MSASFRSSFRRLLVGLLCFVSCYAVCTARDKYSHVQVGDTIPQFEVRLIDGTLMRSADMVAGVTVLIFFDTQCYDCRRELPILERLYAEYGGCGVRFLAISRSDAADAVSRYWADNALTLPVAADPERRVYRRFAQRMVPRVYVVGRDGVVVAQYHTKARRRALRKVLTQQLAQHTPS